MLIFQSRYSWFCIRYLPFSLALFAAAILNISAFSLARADVIIAGCTVVSNPTATHFTNCPNANLANANFSAVVDLRFANFSGAKLSGANLSDLEVDDANFSGANLTGADLQGDSLNRANLAGAILTNANLFDADLSAGSLTGVTWSNTTCPDNSNSNNHGNTCIGHLLLPTITATVLANGAPYTAGGWTKQNVTVRFTCAAAPGRKLAPQACPIDQSFSAEGVFTATGVVEDLDGFFNTTSFAPIQIDRTAPSVVASAKKADNTPYVVASWSNQNVTLHFACSDTGSGLAAPCPAEQLISNEGITPPIGTTATDKAGNSASASFGPIQIDKTKPIIAGNRTPPANKNGWNASDVTVSFTCVDNQNGSGLASNTVAGATLSNEGANQSITNSGACIDNAANSANAVTVSAIHIDKSAPETMITNHPIDPGPSVATFEISGTDSLSAITNFTCSLDGAAFSACANPQQYSGLAVGSHTFQVQATNAAELVDTSPATYTWRVDDALPVANEQTVTTAEESALSITLTGSGKNALTYTLVSTPTHGILSGIPPALIYTPTLNFNGNDAFSFQVNDGQSNSNVAKVRILVTPVNDLPVINQAALTLDEDTPISFTLGVVDVDGDTLTYSVLSAPEHGSLRGTLPNVTYVPTLNFNGSDQVVFGVSDGHAEAVTATVNISINAVNDAPLAVNQMLTTPPSTGLSLTLVATDAESSPLSYTVVTSPQHGTLSGTAPNLIYTPAAGFNGNDQVTFTVSDGQLTSNTASIEIRVTNNPYLILLPLATR